MSSFAPLAALPMLTGAALPIGAQETSTLGSLAQGVERGLAGSRPQQQPRFDFSVERLVTALLGLILVLAALFSHPAVREKIVAAGKAAGEATLAA